MAKRSALGKGLGAFFGDDVVREADERRSSSHSEDMDSLHAEKEDVNPEERTTVLRNRRKNPFPKRFHFVCRSVWGTSALTF